MGRGTNQENGRPWQTRKSQAQGYCWPWRHTEMEQGQVWHLLESETPCPAGPSPSPGSLTCCDAGLLLRMHSRSSAGSMSADIVVLILLASLIS